jgi:hypothetical protein
MAEKFTVEELQFAATQEYPDWYIWRIDRYGSGEWQGEMAINCDIGLYRLSGNQLELKNLYGFLSPLRKDDRIPWKVTEWVSVPLTDEASKVIATISPIGIASYDVGFVFPDAALSGCADFLLEDGMAWQTLIAYPDFLVGIAQNAEGLQSLRIAHWDGSGYVHLSASTPQKAQFSIYTIHSYNDSLELHTEEADLNFQCDSDGNWRIEGINNGAKIISVHENGLEDITYGGDGQNNVNYHYGYPTFATTLEEVDLLRIPTTLEEALPLLDAERLACTTTDDSRMYDSPDGELIATCYSRAVGQVKEVQGEWVRLQLGSSEFGLSGWFLSSELSFGKDIENIICGFPSYAYEEMESQHLRSVMPDISVSLDEFSNEVWLIGRSPDGGWLVSVNEQQVMFAHENAFSEIRPTEYGY